MKTRVLLLCLAMLPVLANAEIYKWKEKDGVVRYSDVPPPSNIKHEPIRGQKVVKPTGQEALAPVEGDVTTIINRNKTAADKNNQAKDNADKLPLSKDDAAKKRAQDAESQKKIDEQKQAELKVRQENCKAAKSNLATFTNGGRISKTDESGNRQYLGDDDIAKGKADAQHDVEKYCD